VRRLFEASDADGWICKPLTRDKLIGAVTRFITGGMLPSATPSRTTVPERAAHRVLLIEDESVISSRIESVLASSCAVTTVVDGGAAIEHLLADPFDCILLDLMLPHLSGFDVLRHVVLRKPELLKSTVIMTAATDESLQFIDPKAVAGILRKPFEVGALPELVSKIARR